MLKKARLKKEITTLERAIFMKTVFKHLLSHNCSIGEQDTVCTLIQLFTFSLNAQKAPNKTPSCRVRPFPETPLAPLKDWFPRFIKMGLPSSGDSFIKPRSAESHQHKGISQGRGLKPAVLSRQSRHDRAVPEEGGERPRCSRNAPCVLQQTLSGGRAGVLELLGEARCEAWH